MNRLIERLQALLGPAHCRVDPAALEPHLVEPRGLFRGQAQAVVRPGSTAEVSAVVALCAEAGVAVVPQGGNTGMCGGGVPSGGPTSVVLSTERLTRVRAIDRDNFTMTVEAGCILATLQETARGAGLLFPLSLGAEGSCRIGGNLSTNAGGIQVLRYGNARELMLGLEVVLPDGRVWDGLRPLRKDNTGYALRHLFVGAEGTLGIITAACLKLFPLPADVQTAFIAVADPAAALEVFVRLRQASAWGVREAGLVLVTQRAPGTPGLLQRTWRVRARRVVVATGAVERALVFRDNDRPGVMLAGAVQAYLHRHAVVPGRRVLVFTNNGSAYEVVRDLLA